MSTQKYLATIRSKTTFGTEEVVIEVHPGQKPEYVASEIAASYGATVVSITPENPTKLLLGALRECLGFVEAWQMHLNDTGATKAAETTKDVLDRSRDAYQLVKASLPVS